MSNLIEITVKGEKTTIPKGTTLLELSKKYAKNHKYDIILAKVNNELTELFKTVSEGSNIEFLDITDENGFRTYQRTVAFLMIYAAKEIIGVKTRVIVEHSIGKNYYCEIKDVEITDELLVKIENKMQEKVNNDFPIEKYSLPIEKAIELCREFGLEDKEKILKYRRTSNVNFYKLDWFYDYFYGQMANSCGCLHLFKLHKKNNGLLIQFPSNKEQVELLEVKPLDKISQIFKESSDWAKIVEVDTVGALNEAISNGKIKELIQVTEALHEKKIIKIADEINEMGKKIILIAGPSSSGKTTFANRLKTQLSVNGLKAHIISLDNYYKPRAEIPLDKFGAPNFEALNAIDVKQINIDLNKLLNGEEVIIPNFNFISGAREYKGKYISLNNDEVIIMEGIHGLNDKLTYDIEKKIKFKIFISALTQLNIDDHNRIPTTDTRLIRRIVRDSIYRGTNPAKTIEMWPSVVRGEVENIFPFQEEADAFFNSALIYEMCVLKQFVESRLFSITNREVQYTEARRLIKFLDCFLGVSSEEVPSNSLLREFVGGSCFAEV